MTPYMIQTHCSKSSTMRVPFLSSNQLLRDITEPYLHMVRLVAVRPTQCSALKTCPELFLGVSSIFLVISMGTPKLVPSFSFAALTLRFTTKKFTIY